MFRKKYGVHFKLVKYLPIHTAIGVYIYITFVRYSFAVLHHQRHVVPAVHHRGRVRIFGRHSAPAPVARLVRPRRRRPSLLDRYVPAGSFLSPTIIIQPDSLFSPPVPAASLPLLLSPVGSLLFGYMSDRFGRKNSLQLTYVPLFLSWALLSKARCLDDIYLGRLLAGFATGECTFLFVCCS